MSQSLQECGAEQCHDRGDCVLVNGLPVCKCMLGYRGERCENTVNGGLSVPLTLGVLGVIAAMIILAFVFSYVRQKRKAKQREKEADAMEALKSNGDHSISHPKKGENTQKI